MLRSAVIKGRTSSVLNAAESARVSPDRRGDAAAVMLRMEPASTERGTRNSRQMYVKYRHLIRKGAKMELEALWDFMYASIPG